MPEFLRAARKILTALPRQTSMAEDCSWCLLATSSFLAMQLAPREKYFNFQNYTNGDIWACEV